MKYKIRTALVTLAATAVGVSCTDTWDDHYSVGSSVPGTTLWELLESDESLSAFARVLEACGYDDVLNADQVFTVWAPAITESEADELIAKFAEEEAAGKDEEENYTIYKFIQNHISMYNQQVSSLTASDGEVLVKMLNGKKMSLTPTTLNDEVALSAATPASNGALYKLDGELTFLPNIWEAVQDECTGGDDGLDSVAAYFLTFQEEDLDEESSVAGGVVDGKTVYLDSVIVKYNEFFNAYGNIDEEDSLYWFVPPTNKIWNDRLDTYKSYFNFHTSAGTEEEIDSLQNMYAKNTFVYSSFFNVNAQKPVPFNEEDPDSLCATTYTSRYPDYSKFEYPKRDGGLLYGLTGEECSNGLLYKPTDWRIPATKVFYFRKNKVEAEQSSYYTTKTMAGDSTSIQVSTITADNDSFSVSNDSYLRVTDSRAQRTNQPEITFYIPNTLSNCPYDIKVVFATPLAGDSLATDDAAQKRQVSAYINYYNSTSATSMMTNASTLNSSFDVDASKMDTVLVKEGFTFPACHYGLDDEGVMLTLQSTRTRSLPDGYSSTLYIDCVIFEPKPTDSDGN